MILIARTERFLLAKVATNQIQPNTAREIQKTPARNVNTTNSNKLHAYNAIVYINFRSKSQNYYFGCYKIIAICQKFEFKILLAWLVTSWGVIAC